MDQKVRQLERAISCGDPVASSQLAAMHFRAGRQREALAVLGRLDTPPADLAEREQAAWREELSGLAPLHHIEVDALVFCVSCRVGTRYLMLATFGPDSRLDHDVLVDLEARRARRVEALAGASPMGEAGGSTFFGRGEEVLRVRPGEHAAAPIIEPVLLVPRGQRPALISPDGRYLVAEEERRRGRARTVLSVIEDDHTRPLAVFSCSVGEMRLDWIRRRVAWLERSDRGTKLALASFDPAQAVRRLRLPRDPERPARSPGVYWTGDEPTLTALRDGRLATTRPLSVVHPETDEGVILGGDLTRPQLARSGRDLLAVHEGRVVRVDIAPDAGKRFARRDGWFESSISYTCWHPLADAAARGGDFRGEAVWSADGHRLVALPRGARPFDWIDGGAALVVATRFDGSKDRVELWGPCGPGKARRRKRTPAPFGR